MNALRDWYRECEQHRDLNVHCVARAPKFLRPRSEWQLSNIALTIAVSFQRREVFTVSESLREQLTLRFFAKDIRVRNPCSLDNLAAALNDLNIFPVLGN